VKIRLMDTEGECREVAGRLAGIVDMLEASALRGDQG
jgi:hypothetical protein